MWEAVSPDPVLAPHEADYRWLSQVHESVRPAAARLLWHALGARTIELIRRNVHIDAVRDDLDTLVLDAVLGAPDPERKSKEIEIQVAGRLRRHVRDPRFRALGERLEALRRKHEQGLLVSVEFLKSLLDLARDVVEAERHRPARHARRARKDGPDRAVRRGAQRPDADGVQTAVHRVAHRGSSRLERQALPAVLNPAGWRWQGGEARTDSPAFRRRTDRRTAGRAAARPARRLEPVSSAR